MRLVSIALWMAANTAAAAGFDHRPWSELLARHVNAVGEVDYAALKANRAPLDSYVAALSAASPDSRKDLFPTRESELAYWINAYNALTIRAVVDAYPVRSVRDLGFLYGFFRRQEHTLGGRKVSLQELENEIIRKRYGDARIHFAIVCASVSCPRLLPAAYLPEMLDRQLDEATTRSLAENRNVAFDPAKKTATLTPIFKWYGQDYRPSVGEFIARYLSGDRLRQWQSLGTRPTLRYFDYDWSINEPGSRARAGLVFERELAQEVRNQKRSQ